MKTLNIFTRGCSAARRLIKGGALIVAVCTVFSAGNVMAAPKDTAKPAATTQQVTSSVNINKADAETLASALVGVGQAKAEAIVAYRAKNGEFKSIEQLADVKGIGEATVAKNKSRLTL